MVKPGQYKPLGPHRCSRGAVWYTERRLDLENENLRAQVKSLQYEVNSLKSERDFEKLRHEQNLQDVQARANADFKKAQVAKTNGVA